MNSTRSFRTRLAVWIAVASWSECVGDQADIVCNECAAVLRTVPVEQATSTMVEIASGEICSARCTSCGALNTYIGFSSIDALICSVCGESVATKGRMR